MKSEIVTQRPPLPFPKLMEFDGGIILATSKNEVGYSGTLVGVPEHWNNNIIGDVQMWTLQFNDFYGVVTLEN